MNPGDIIVQKVVTLFYREMQTDAPDHLRIVLATLESPQKPGGKSRAAVVLYPENSRFISLCMRRSSAKGSTPKRGNSERAMASPLRVFTLLTSARPD